LVLGRGKGGRGEREGKRIEGGRGGWMIDGGRGRGCGYFWGIVSGGD